MSQGADPAGEMWDVIVVGSGPAGSATALTLARLGRRALLVEKRRSTGVKLGETLPPASIDLIAHFLGPETGTAGRPFDAFPTTGNVSSWASEGADAADFFFASSGHGLCVDRPAFDDALRDAAAAAGATLLKGASFQSCERVLDGSLNWRVTLATDAGARQDRARYLVDCSGRQAVVGRALGASIEDDDDRLFAYARWFSCPGGDDDRRTRIEAAPEGWWYSSRLPGAVGGETGRLVVFYTDRDLPAARLAASPDGFDGLLERSAMIAPVLRDRGYRPYGAIRGAPAGGQRLQAFCGDAWMAVGDAAQAYDPLSSQGVDKALKSASDAGHLIHYALEDSSQGEDCSQGAAELDARNPYVVRHDEAQRRMWDEYLRRRAFYYGAVRRWPGEAFWRRRLPVEQAAADADEHRLRASPSV